MAMETSLENLITNKKKIINNLKKYYDRIS